LPRALFPILARPAYPQGWHDSFLPLPVPLRSALRTIPFPRFRCGLISAGRLRTLFAIDDRSSSSCSRAPPHPLLPADNAQQRRGIAGGRGEGKGVAQPVVKCKSRSRRLNRKEPSLSEVPYGCVYAV
jgi:hypothetical protein